MTLHSYNCCSISDASAAEDGCRRRHALQAVEALAPAFSTSQYQSLKDHLLRLYK